ncbi:MAG: serine hydrolase [Cyclobacteriaceae bacterium]|nr:serine hydrolase [Cyclobacteriaceae bacterium]
MKSDAKKIALIATFLVLHGGVKAQTSLSPERAAILQQKLDNSVTAFNLPGISASIINADGDYWSGASGLSDIHTLDLMNTGHLFYQASVTKMFVATIIFQLIEEKQISLDDSVGLYLPVISTVPSDTRIRYLLNHRSGIYDVFSNAAARNNWYATPNAIWNPKDVMETYNSNPSFAQGTSFLYSNTNYMLLGMIIEQITGDSFAQVLKDKILIPYNLNQTFFLPEDTVTGSITKGWTSFTLPNTYDTDAAPILTTCYASMSFTSGALISSPQDVVKFTRLLLSGEILSHATLDIMRTCTNVNLGNNSNGYGYGLMRYVFDGKTYYGHAGDLSGFTQLTVHNNTDGITLTISINRNNAPRGAIAIELLSALQNEMILSVEAQPENESRIEVYPNPSTGKVNIKFGDKTNQKKRIDIYNHLGQNVWSTMLKNGKHSITANLKNNPDGLYFIQVTEGLTSETSKIIIKR